LSRLVSRESLDSCQSPEEWLQVYQELVVAGELEPSERFEQLERIVAGYKAEQQNAFERGVQGWIESTFGSVLEQVETHKIIGGIATDLLLTYKGIRMIVECDGDAYHLLSGPDGGRIPGKDIIQARLFERFGYEVVHVRDSDFRTPLGKDKLAQELQKKLEGGSVSR
jgi:hypothetical protein